MLAHLREYYSAAALRGVRGHAARTVRQGMADHRSEGRRIPEDRDDQGGYPLAFAVDGRDYHDDPMFGPRDGREPRPIFAPATGRRWAWTTHYLARRRSAIAAERRWHALDRIAQRHHV